MRAAWANHLGGVAKLFLSFPVWPPPLPSSWPPLATRPRRRRRRFCAWPMYMYGRSGRVGRWLPGHLDLGRGRGRWMGGDGRWAFSQPCARARVRGWYQCVRCIPVPLLRACRSLLSVLSGVHVPYYSTVSAGSSFGYFGVIVWVWVRRIHVRARLVWEWPWPYRCCTWAGDMRSLPEAFNPRVRAKSK